MSISETNEDMPIGSKSVFTPEFQKQLFEHLGSDKIHAYEMLMRTSVQRSYNNWMYPTIDEDEDAEAEINFIELAAITAAMACQNLTVHQAKQVLKRAQFLIEYNAPVKTQHLHTHPLVEKAMNDV